MKVVFLCCQAQSLLSFRKELMCALMDKGCEVLAFAPEPEAQWRERFIEIGVSYGSLKLQKNGTNPFSDLAGMADILKKLKAVKPDAVFCYHAKTVIYGSIAAKLAKVKRRIALIAGVGSVLRDKPTNLKSRLVRGILALEYRAGLSAATAVFFQNHDDSELFLSKRLVKENKIAYINGSGVNLERFTQSPVPEAKRFLFVGRLIRDKGLVEYLTAARELKSRMPDAEFGVIGYFDTNPTSLSMADIQPFIDDGSIAFYGFQEDVRPCLDACCCFVLPSYHEGTPKSALEALAVGRPVVTSDTVGCRETVVNGENGILVPVGDSAALVKALERIAGDYDMCRSMGERSHRLAVEKFDVRAVNGIIVSAVLGDSYGTL